MHFLSKFIQGLFAFCEKEFISKSASLYRFQLSCNRKSKVLHFQPNPFNGLIKLLIQENIGFGGETSTKSWSVLWLGSMLLNTCIPFASNKTKVYFGIWKATSNISFLLQRLITYLLSVSHSLVCHSTVYLSSERWSCCYH